MSADLTGTALAESLGAEGAASTEAKIAELEKSGLSPAAQQAIRDGMAEFSVVLLKAAAGILAAGKEQRFQALVMFYDFVGRTCIELRDSHRRMWGIE